MLGLAGHGMPCLEHEGPMQQQLSSLQWLRADVQLNTHVHVGAQMSHGYPYAFAKLVLTLNLVQSCLPCLTVTKFGSCSRQLAGASHSPTMNRAPV